MKQKIEELDHALRLAAVRLRIAADICGGGEGLFIREWAKDAREALGIPRSYTGDILVKYSDGSNAVAFPDGDA